MRRHVGRDSRNASQSERDQAVLPYLAAMEAFATPSLMMPEQVWDGGPAAGQPTGAATPLGWSHAEYLKLLRSRRDGRVFDLLDFVLERSTQLSITRRSSNFREAAEIRH